MSAVEEVPVLEWIRNHGSQRGCWRILRSIEQGGHVCGS